MADIAALTAHLAGLGRALLGYSGGVDSGLLAVAGRQALGPDRFLAVIGRSASYPAVQYRAAIDLAKQFDVPLLELTTHELDDPRYSANLPSRCYFCKSELWTQLGTVAAERGFDVILDGTNADDLTGHRPGHRAATERQIRSPLLELGWGKDQVRAAAHELGLPNWNAPGSPCLASRLRYGLSVTPERLRQVELAEEFLRGKGISGDLRVRHLDRLARIEAVPSEFSKIEAIWDQIQARFGEIGFAEVSLDPKGYRRGALLDLERAVGG
ncbi:MAG TPA: ATP-dependent sacrificial sulfur transferase LarE [Gemmatimonadales bacterium]|nr:ATP-dependent sacrificial sulfur transferase LarE [Gemmatimonadales bacterium]